MAQLLKLIPADAENAHGIDYKMLPTNLHAAIDFVGTIKVGLHLATYKPRSHFAEYIFRLFTIEINSTIIEINSAIANNLKPIGMMKMHCVTIYPNSYECVSGCMKIHHGGF